MGLPPIHTFPIRLLTLLWQMSENASRSARPMSPWPLWCLTSPRLTAASASNLFPPSRRPVPVRHPQLWCYAGLLVRLTHRLWRVRHSAQIYVDDLLAILLRSSAPLLSALRRSALCSSRPNELARVTWIGWSFDFETFTVELDPSKLRRLLDLLRLLSESPRCTVSALEKLTGKLLWLSNLFQSFRPSLRQERELSPEYVACPRQLSSAFQVVAVPSVVCLRSLCRRMCRLRFGWARRFHPPSRR